MNTKPIPAWTLPELLIVMILSGLVFLALLDAIVLVGRYTDYITVRCVRTEEDLSACCRLDELLSRIDSMAVEEDVLQLYCQDVPLADLRVSDDSLLCCHYRNRKDTLLRGVEKMVLDGDTLIIQFCLSQEKIRYRWNINRTIWP